MTGDPMFDDLLYRLLLRALERGACAALTVWQRKHRSPESSCPCCGHQGDHGEAAKGSKSERG